MTQRAQRGRFRLGARLGDEDRVGFVQSLLGKSTGEGMTLSEADMNRRDGDNENSLRALRADSTGDPLRAEGAAVPGKHGLSPSAELTLSPLGG